MSLYWEEMARETPISAFLGIGIGRNEYLDYGFLLDEILTILR